MQKSVEKILKDFEKRALYEKIHNGFMVTIIPVIVILFFFTEPFKISLFILVLVICIFPLAIIYSRCPVCDSVLPRSKMCPKCKRIFRIDEFIKDSDLYLNSKEVNILKPKIKIGDE